MCARPNLTRFPCHIPLKNNPVSRIKSIHFRLEKMNLVEGIVGILLLLLLLALLFRLLSGGYGYGCGSSFSRSRSKVHGIFSNQGAIDTTAGPILWDASTDTVHPHLSLNATTGAITLPRGKYLVQYTVRLAQSPFDGTSTAVAQLQQTVNNVLTNITQPAIINNSHVDGLTNAQQQANPVIIGSAIICVTSHQDNKIAVNFTPDTNNVMAATTGLDANAQIVISQI